jgi:hypothetical protein
MMSDIVERLRKYKTNGDPTKYTAFATVAEIHEAAAEIERWRDVAKVDSEVASELLAERGKLLAALEWIANARTAMDGGSIAENRKIAADALKGCPNA